MRLVLASGSPRRRELLSALGATFTVMVTEAEESDELAPEAVTAALPAASVPLGDHPTLRAWRKAQAVCEEVSDAVVIGADTVVVVDGEALNKPANGAAARAMLRRLAGRTHMVYTGLCVLKTIERLGAADEGVKGGGLENRPLRATEPARIWLDLVATEVEFRTLDDAEIADYVATGEPLDKAGAYGVQGLGGRLVRQVRGSYTAVVGFPLVATHSLLSAAGISGLNDPTATYHRWLQSQGKEPLPWPPTLP